ncbi:MAG: ATP-binding protein, partial [Pseudomonadota bacterium]
DLNDLVAETVSKLSGVIDASDAQIQVDEMPNVYGDKKLLCDAFYYLIDNAIKFQPDGQTPKVVISCQDRDGKACFVVSDNGIGMDPKTAERALIILRKLNRPDAYEGRGAGLAFTKKIIEIHNGDIWIETEPQKGTSVFFTLNLKPN